MQEVLVVVDMQNDFIDGPLGSEAARAIVPAVVKKVEGFKGLVFFTKDTHYDNYYLTQEGINLPVPHCIKGYKGWRIISELNALRKTEPIEKNTFGGEALAYKLREENARDGISKITFVGVCTDICVISNALLVKAFLPEAEIVVDAACCAGVTKESHEIALKAMKACQIKIENAEGI